MHARHRQAKRDRSKTPLRVALTGYPWGWYHVGCQTWASQLAHIDEGMVPGLLLSMASPKCPDCWHLCFGMLPHWTCHASRTGAIDERETRKVSSGFCQTCGDLRRVPCLEHTASPAPCCQSDLHRPPLRCMSPKKKQCASCHCFDQCYHKTSVKQ